MRTLYFYSVPGSTIPSPYFFRVPKMLRVLSRASILRFRLWQGRHEAPVPLDDGPEPIATELPKEEKMIRLKVQFYADGFREWYLDLPESVKDLPPDGLWEGGPKESYQSERRALVMGRLQAAFPYAEKISIITCKYVDEATPILPAAPWPIRTEIGAQP